MHFHNVISCARLSVCVKATLFHCLQILQLLDQGFYWLQTTEAKLIALSQQSILFFLSIFRFPVWSSNNSRFSASISYILFATMLLNLLGIELNFVFLFKFEYLITMYWIYLVNDNLQGTLYMCFLLFSIYTYYYEYKY